VLSLVVPVIANGMRAFGIIAIAEALNNAAAVEADHIIYGWVFFTFVTLALIFIGMSFADDRTKSRAAPEPPSPAVPPRTLNLALVAVAGMVVVAIGPAYAAYRDWRGATVDLANVMPPQVASPWMPTAAVRPEWHPVIQDPDREFLRTFDDNGRNVTQYVALYGAKGFHNNLVRGTNDIADPKHWQSTGTGRRRVGMDGGEATVATNFLTGTGQRLLVWDFYVVNGKIVASPMQAKLAQLTGIVGRSDDVAAFVAIATEENGNGAESAGTLQKFLASMEPMSRYLESSTRR
jgi:EpsI family protein